jgi:hypothetical protein
MAGHNTIMHRLQVAGRGEYNQTSVLERLNISSMRTFRLFLYLFSAAMLICLSAIAQPSATDTLIEKFDRYRLTHSQEKLYLHSDRNLYMTGEIMWFKIYCTDATLHHPLDLSKVAYVELLDQNNLSLLKGKIGLSEGVGSGSFYLPSSIVTGNYILRGYTKWMKNNSPEFFFHKVVTIINPFLNLDLPAEKTVSALQVDFFPEGGNLITGIKSKVAFSVKNEDGKGVDCKLVLLNIQNDTLASVRSSQFGLGYFYYTPHEGSHDRVIVIDHDRKISTHNLPVPAETGFAIQLQDSTEQYLSLAVRHWPLKNLPSNIYLFVHARQIIALAEMKTIDRNMTIFQIDKNKLSDGISHITLFDSNLKPVCERLYFKHPKKKLELKVQSAQQQYSTRRKVQLNLTSLISDKPVVANLSVSIYKSDSLNRMSRNGIFEYLWLSSDLTGSIESPEYYFSDDELVRPSIDLLMLTHGWRRFHWNDVMRKPPLIRFLPEHYSHVVEGRVTNLDGVPVADVKTYLASPDKVIRTYAAVSSETGSVKFELPDFFGTKQLTAQTMSYTPSQVSIENPFSEAYVPFKTEKVVFYPALKNAIMERSIFMQTQDIYYEGQRDHFQFPQVDTVAFYGKATETYYLDDYTRFPVMEEVMREYVPGVRVRKHNDKFVFVMIDTESKTSMRGDPMVLLDGVPVRRADDIMAFDPRKVKKLEVIAKSFYLGPTTQNGIVSYTTYAGDLGGFTLDPSVLTIDYEGLQLQREFHHPSYETSKQRLDKLPDFRNLLGWFPNIKTNEQGQFELELYTSDLTGNYAVVVEGLTKTGFSGKGIFTFSVKESQQ